MALLSGQAARPRYARSYNLHSGLRPSLVFKPITFSKVMPVVFKCVFGTNCFLFALIYNYCVLVRYLLNFPINFLNYIFTFN